METLQTIKYSSEYPPNWPTLIKIFKGAINWDNGIIITWGDTYYSKKPVAPDLVAHETVHMNQQMQTEGGPEKWWERYYMDPVFRLHQEVEAYRAQLAFYKNSLMNVSRPERKFKSRKAAESMAMALSSEIYGNIIGYNQALELIS